MSSGWAYSWKQREQIEPLAQLLRDASRPGETTIVGVNGGQGTGKSTLTAYLVDLLGADGLRLAVFSIDDFYMSYADRRRLADRYPGNPYYQLPRGMPGTHRIDALCEALLRLKAGQDVDLPVFDASAHQGYGDVADRVQPVRGRQDIVLFEGWCVGIPSATPHEIAEVVRKHDLEKVSAVPSPSLLQDVLNNIPAYERAWTLIDVMVVLVPDSPASHERWRLQREQDTLARGESGLSPELIRDFVRHCLPLTYLCYEKIRPDARLRIDEDHRFYGFEGP